MNSQTIRQSFLHFFKSKNHAIVPSAPIVAKNDPTLMFINAGMNQFKDIFLDNEKATNLRVVDTQRCLRVSGKHNDLEEVGYDGYHHTMFEMLGNWSFGDYFKKEAIHWAWEWLTKELQLSPDRLYVTVFSGDKKDALAQDDEAKHIWETILPKEKILLFGKKDNFWEMGNTGPCGPCSEIHFDCRSEEDRKKTDAVSLVNQGHPEVIEIWNLVFIQFNRNQDGKLVELKNKHIDTGLGLERVVRVKQGVKSNYDTDIFKPYFDDIEKHTHIKYSASDSKTDIAMRVLADHIRALTFTIADGQLPSNTGAGYVVRRILRRAVRYYYSFLNTQEPLLFKLASVCLKQFENVFPEIQSSREIVMNTIHEEEKSFLRTLASGLKRIDELVDNEVHKKITGVDVFKLYDTYGFPFDLSEMILKEKGISINSDEFEQELQKQKQRSRQDQKVDTTDWEVMHEGNSIFVGYDTLQTQTHILKYRRVEHKGEQVLQIVLEQNPFYTESGGQKGDSGWLHIGNQQLEVFDSVKENVLPVLLVKMVDDLPNLKTTITAQVDATKRQKIAQHHTAGHLLNAALQNILGQHVKQKGAYLDDTYLRFDFSHNEKVSREELDRIEQIVNRKIQENIPVITEIVEKEQALQRATAAMFGEKYADEVRLICIDEKNKFSVELCGGTHVKSTGEIGFFKIIKESSVAAGIRRVEAVAAQPALDYLHSKLDILDNLHALLKNPKDLVGAFEKLQETIKEKTEISEVWKKALLQELVKKATENIHTLKDKKIFVQLLDIPSFEIANLLARQVIQTNLAEVACVGVVLAGNKHHFILTKSKQSSVDCQKFVVEHILSNAENSGGGNPNQSVFMTNSHYTLEKILTLLKSYFS